MDPYLYTIKETAALLQVNRNKVYDLINAGLLKPVKLGYLKVSRIELNKFLVRYAGKDLSDLYDVREFKANEHSNA